MDRRAGISSQVAEVVCALPRASFSSPVSPSATHPEVALVLGSREGVDSISLYYYQHEGNN